MNYGFCIVTDEIFYYRSKWFQHTNTTEENDLSNRVLEFGSTYEIDVDRSISR